MSCFKFYDGNFLDINIVANTDVSSEQAAFPIENAYTQVRRAKVWRSNGYYEINSTNNVLIFRESVGVDLTATILEGEYTRAQFMAAVKAALELTGASTYTVTFNSQFKFNIASNGAGGGGIFEIRAADVLSTAIAPLGLGNTNLSGALNYTCDAISIHTSEWILWDLGIDSDPTMFALIDARNSPLSLSPNATVLLQGNHTNNWTTPVYSQVLTYTDYIVSVINEDGLAGEALRYWRVKFVDQSPNGYVQVGAFYLGGEYEAVRGKPQFPFIVNHVDRTQTVYSEGGQTFSEIKPKTETFTLDWFALTTEEKEYFEYMFQIYGTGIPFFVGIDNGAEFSTEYNYYIRYVKFSNEPRFNLTRPGIWTCETTFEEQL